jgi:hypothetical protein
MERAGRLSKWRKDRVWLLIWGIVGFLGAWACIAVGGMYFVWFMGVFILFSIMLQQWSRRARPADTGESP